MVFEKPGVRTVGLAVAACERTPPVGAPADVGTQAGDEPRTKGPAPIGGRPPAAPTSDAPATPARASGAECFRLSDAEITIVAKPSRLVSSRAFECLGLLASEARMLPRKMRYRPLPEAIEGLLGVAPTDVAEVTFEMSFMRLGAKFLVSLVTLEPVEQAAVVTRVSEATRETLKPMGAHAGVSLYGFGRGDEVVIAFVGPKLVVFGSPLAV